ESDSFEPRAGLLRARALLRKYIPEGVNLSDELIAERRAEAANESENSDRSRGAAGLPDSWAAGRVSSVTATSEPRRTGSPFLRKRAFHNWPRIDTDKHGLRSGG